LQFSIIKTVLLFCVTILCWATLIHHETHKKQMLFTVMINCQIARDELYKQIYKRPAAINDDNCFEKLHQIVT